MRWILIFSIISFIFNTNTNASSECGRIKVKVSHPLSFNGSESIPGLFPWLASLFHVRKKYVCGSSIITKRHILTAAHCVETKAEDYHAIFGRFDISNDSETNWIRRNMSKVYVHEEFDIQADAHRSYADIAIFEFLLEIPFTNYIQPICLPHESANVINLTGIVAGYGKTEIYGDYQNTPSYVKLKSIRSWSCLRKNVRYNDIVSEKTFCAGSATAIPCQGDSGGAYFALNQSTRRYTVYGIVSFAIGLCDPADYVAFTDVTQFIPWINEKIKVKTQNRSLPTCIEAIVNCCSRYDEIVRQPCFESYNCRGVFFRQSPCSAAMKLAALKEAEKYT